ncbi:MAG TPA: DUF1801 domain-containing protein [Polyangiaceae bacterium]|jgi:hypothetical protein|nr:DUF1801 domain-containing protein [Polyangiaceae bacterium]
MQSRAGTVEQYLADLPDDRREAIQAVREVILKNLDKGGIEEGMQYGMIAYYVPHRVFPAGYHCDPRQPLPFASIASQKSHMALYLMCVYADAENERWFREEWARSGKKLDMGKSCVRFKKLSDVPLDVIGKLIKRVPAKGYVEQYQAAREAAGQGSASRKAAAANGEPAAKKTAAAPKKTAAAPKKTAAAAPKKTAAAPKKTAARRAN